MPTQQATAAHPANPMRPVHPSSATAVVLDWNHTMIDALEVALTPPPPAVRIGAIVQASVFDAVNGVTHEYTPFRVATSAPPNSSAAAAAAGAAHEALLKLFPTQQPALDAALAATLSQLTHDPAGPAGVTSGLAWGTQVADDILTWRAGDGISAVLPPYMSSTDPGRWQPTPPLFGPPAFRQFADMTPWVMSSPGQFLPGPTPALTSARYTRDFNEVASIGQDTSSTRSAFDTQTAVFVQSDVPVAIWDRVADDLIAGSHHLGITAAARLLAAENMAMADAVISVWNAKNFFDTWRPVTAIRAADTDGNPATAANSSWSPLLTTPAFQEYPAGHPGVSAAALAVLSRTFGEHTHFTATSATMPGVERHYTSFTAAKKQVVDARVFGGIHFRTAGTVAVRMGNQVARLVTSTAMLPAACHRS